MGRMRKIRFKPVAFQRARWPGSAHVAGWVTFLNSGVLSSTTEIES